MPSARLSASDEIECNADSLDTEPGLNAVLTSVVAFFLSSKPFTHVQPARSGAQRSLRHLPKIRLKFVAFLLMIAHYLLNGDLQTLESEAAEP